MVEVASDVYEWRIENFSCWDAEVHGNSIDCPKLALRYVLKICLYPRKINGQSKQMTVMFDLYFSNVVPTSGFSLSFIDSAGSRLYSKQFPPGRLEKWITIDSELTFQEVATLVKEKGDQLILRISLPSEKDHSISGSTTLDVLKLSMPIDQKSIESLELYGSKNISIIRYFEKNELLLKAIRQEETVEFILELLTKPENAISVESQYSLQSTDKTLEREEENKHLFHYCEPWNISNPLNWCELMQKGFTMILSLKIINGSQILKRLNDPAQSIAVPKDTLSIFDPSSMKNKECAPSKQTVDSVTALTQDLMHLYQDPEFSDITLKCDNVTFPVHKVILSARSPVFKTMLSCDMKEASSGEVDIGDLDPSTLSRFLTYLYTGAVEEELQCDRAFKLYYAADKYQVLSLKEVCADFLSASVSLSNVCDILSLAHKHEDDDLKLVAQDFVLDNYTQVLTSIEWGNLVKTKPSLVAETLTSFAAKCSLVKIGP